MPNLFAFAGTQALNSQGLRQDLFSSELIESSELIINHADS
jgi:hypothetical protein